MEPTEAITIIALCLCALALFLLLIAVWRVGGTLQRVESLLRERPEPAAADFTRHANATGSPEPVAASPQPAAVQRTPLPSKDGQFAEFLAEHPETATMKKSEQSAAFRKWRRERGLSWSGADPSV